MGKRNGYIHLTPSLGETSVPMIRMTECANNWFHGLGRIYLGMISPTTGRCVSIHLPNERSFGLHTEMHIYGFCLTPVNDKLSGMRLFFSS